ncbi:hypothetical protein CBM2597_U10054 [Cupriavidus taiwanensis]|uniref:Thioesterase n=1 Tax=Cupriavidus taiwanensis TaxID=164546 RepID=A0A7Z7JHP1_9BURK|nr:hypothetical protein CBM2597_U10054 [Cupriavidus taiwanensis]SPC25560.1 hypothetical protein CBM2594_U10061 [Cupriavidus taiwanensis]
MHISFTHWVSRNRTRCFALQRIGTSSIHLVFTMRDATYPEFYFATATAVWVWIDKESGKSAPVPASLRARCLEFLPDVQGEDR